MPILTPDEQLLAAHLLLARAEKMPKGSPLRRRVLMRARELLDRARDAMAMKAGP